MFTQLAQFYYEDNPLKLFLLHGYSTLSRKTLYLLKAAYLTFTYVYQEKSIIRALHFYTISIILL